MACIRFTSSFILLTLLPVHLLPEPLVVHVVEERGLLLVALLEPLLLFALQLLNALLLGLL